MLARFRLPFALGLLLSLAATTSAADSGQEYAQVRKIAARDEKVRDAFARANERLDARIVALDPALTGYVRTHPSGRAEPEPAEAPVRHPFKPAPARSAPAPTAAPATPSYGKTHSVAAGETLSSIAAQSHVSVAKLQSANHIEDVRKLRVGQTLVIP